MANKRQPANLVGRTFSRWKTIAHAGKIGPNHAWLCRCSCGVEKTVLGKNLVNGGSQSCGCLKKDVNRKRMTRHGRARTKEYHAWQAMIQRCINPNTHDFHCWGGRGISVCPRWLASFNDFLTDMGPAPSPMHSIDRYPNKDGNYEPGNCRWATKAEQSRNSRRNRVLTHDGKTMTIAEWSEFTGLRKMTIVWRLKLGWSISDALTLPPDRSRKRNRR